MKNKRRNRIVQAAMIMVLLLCLQLNANMSTARESKKEVAVSNTTKQHLASGISARLSEELANARASDEHQLFAGVSAVLHNQLQDCRVTVVVPEKDYQYASHGTVDDSKVPNETSETSEETEKMEEIEEVEDEEIEKIEEDEETETVDEVEEKPEPDEYEVQLLAHLINGEGEGVSDECQLLIGGVVLNRVKSEKFPDTLEKVIFQTKPCKQYACVYDRNFDKEPTQQSWDNARWLLENELSEDPVIVLPENVVWQAQFEQGSGVYKKIDGLYFCYE